MKLTPVQVDLVQGSPEWHAWRSGGLGSSDVSVVLGIDPWKKIDTLFAEKTGRVEKEPTKWYMQRGLDDEPDARFLAEWDLGKSFPPTCFTTVEHPWAKASLDGWNTGEILELKRPGKVQHKKYLKSGAPAHYVAQCQWQMGVAGANVTHWASYNPDFPTELQFVMYHLDFDPVEFQRIFDKAHAFYRCLERDRDPLIGLLEQSLKGIYQPL